MTFERITHDPRQMGGKPCIRGLRVTVGMVVGLLAAGYSRDEILKAYPYLELEDIEQAVAAVRQVAQQGDRGHVAVVADDDLLFRRMLLYETSCAAAGVRIIRVFQERPDAECWLEAVSAARHYR